MAAVVLVRRRRSRPSSAWATAKATGSRYDTAASFCSAMACSAGTASDDTAVLTGKWQRLVQQRQRPVGGECQFSPAPPYRPVARAPTRRSVAWPTRRGLGSCTGRVLYGGGGADAAGTAIIRTTTSNTTSSRKARHDRVAATPGGHPAIVHSRHDLEHLSCTPRGTSAYVQLPALCATFGLDARSERVCRAHGRPYCGGSGKRSRICCAREMIACNVLRPTAVRRARWGSAARSAAVGTRRLLIFVLVRMASAC